MIDRSQTSFAAELFVAAELVKQGHIVTITFGNEKAIDILAVEAENQRNMVSIDVKGLRRPAYWALGNYANRKKHPAIYVFCYLNKSNENPQYFIVPKRKVDQLVEYAKDRKSGWIKFKGIQEYKDKWNLIWEKNK